MPLCNSVADARRAASIRAMFTAIAPTYDRLNHLLSFNRDRAWRRAAIALLAPPRGCRVLDLCGGTGDLAIECLAQQPAARVIVADFSLAMLHMARPKTHAATHAADALQLPYADGSFDALTIAFGVRNFADAGRGVREMRRVLKPGGRLLVVEFFRPTSALMAFLFGQMLRRVLPLVGRAISGHPFAYRYLPESVGAFMTRAEFEGLLARMDFEVAESRSLDGGIASVVLAIKPQTP